MSAKVGFVLPHIRGGGAEKVFINLANYFCKEGFKVTLVVGSLKGKDYQELLENGLSIREIKAFSIKDYILKVPTVLKDVNCDVYFTFTETISFAVLLARKKLKNGTKIITTHHNNIKQRLKSLPRLKQIMVKIQSRYIIKHSDGMVFVSSGAREIFFKTIGKPENEKATVIYNPIVNDAIFKKAEEKVALPFRNKYPTFITIGRLDDGKNHILILEALRALQKQDVRINLLILGKGPNYDLLERKIKEYNLENHVVLLGFCANPYKWIAVSDVLVHASKHEGFGNVLVEALALGKNVVSTDCPFGPAEILEDGKYGFLAMNNNVDSLATNMQKAITSPFNVEDIKQRALQFSVKEIAQQYINLFQ